MKIRLNDEDRERLGAPDELDCSIDPFTVADAEAVEEATGMDPFDALKLMVPVREKVDDTTDRFRFKPKGVRLLVWLGLHRAGIEVAFDTLTFSYVPFLGSTLVESGKADPPPGGPANGDSATPSTSPTSGRSTRSKTSNS